MTEFRCLEQATHYCNKCGYFGMNQVHEGCNYDAITISSPAPHPSDLEIVQKALGDSLRLRMSGNDWFVLSVGAIIDSGKDHKSLISWAKQQLGE